MGSPPRIAERAQTLQRRRSPGRRPLRRRLDENRRRLGRPEDIGYVTMFLASERAAMITGQLVSVSGGSFMF